MRSSNPVECICQCTIADWVKCYNNVPTALSLPFHFFTAAITDNTTTTHQPHFHCPFTLSPQQSLTTQQLHCHYHFSLLLQQSLTTQQQHNNCTFTAFSPQQSLRTTALSLPSFTTAITNNTTTQTAMLYTGRLFSLKHFVHNVHEQ